jgi:DNA helicase-2/ATP-dependent DNA helicase PcrA
MSLDDFFKALNSEQKEAVETVSGQLLVLAGAGSGKTRVVTCRIASLLQSGVPPSKILGLTFTNKAANEMKERVETLTQSHVLICTFHSLGVRMLRESIQALDYKRSFTIYDEEDSIKLLRSCIEELGIKDKKLDLHNIKNLISNAKNKLQSPEDLLNYDDKSPESQAFPNIYRRYQERLKEYIAVDFDDLLFLPVRLMRESQEWREYYQHRWEYLLIDEYQDTNQAQYELVRLLVAKTGNLCVVGDPDQSIYSWRGANIKNILNFEADYPGAKVIRLEQNYRSRSNILEAANQLIGHNYNRYEKNLWSNLGAGEKIKHFLAISEKEEARFIVETIRYFADIRKISLKDMVIFYRTNAQSRVFEDRLLFNRIPYVIVGGISFYQRREIKDILAFLRMVHSDTDYISFARTINLPKRGIGDASLYKIHSATSKSNLSVLDYCEALVGDNSLPAVIKLSSKQKEALKEYVSIIRQLQRIKDECSLKELVMSTIQYTHYLAYLQEEKETFEDRKENLDELVSKAMEWEDTLENPSLSLFLEELSLKSSLDEASSTGDRLNLMTIHNGKGLEFAVVFLAGLEEDLFPHANSRESQEGLEEERRLCYVGMTRAKEYLYLTESRFRFLWGMERTQRSSRFIKEIPPHYIERLRIHTR